MTPEEKVRPEFKQDNDDDDFTLANLIATMEEKSNNIAEAVRKLKELMAGIEG